MSNGGSLIINQNILVMVIISPLMHRTNENNCINYK